MSRASKKRKQKEKKQLRREAAKQRGTMTLYTCYIDGDKLRAKTLFRLRGVTKEQYRQIHDDWKQYYQDDGISYLWNGSLLKIYPDRKEEWSEFDNEISTTRNLRPNFAG